LEKSFCSNPSDVFASSLIPMLFFALLSRCRTLFALAFPLLFVGALAAAGLPAVLTGTPPAAVAADPVGLTPEAVAAQRAALQKEIATTRAELGKLPEGKLDDTALWLTQETALLERIDNVYLEQQHTLQHAADLAKEAAEVEERTKARRPPEVSLKPPYGVQLLDQLYAERDYLDQARGWLKTDVANVTASLAEARDTLAEKERARRAARESLAKAADRAKAQNELRFTELESRLAQETVKVREKALHTLKLQQSLLEPKQALLRPSFDWLRAHLVMADDEIAASRTRREKRDAELTAAIAAAKEEADKASRLVITAERRATSAAPTDELESRRADRQTANLTLGVLAAQQERLGEAEKISDLRRRVLAGGATSTDMRTWDATNRTELERLDKQRKLQLTDLDKSRAELQDLQARLSRTSANGDSESPWTVDRARHLQGWLRLSNVEFADLDNLRTERLRLKEELGARVSSFSWSDTTAATWQRTNAAWNYEVFSVKDQPVRVKTILAVIVLIILGHFISRWISALIGRTVFQRMGFNTGRRAAWQTLSFYGLFLIVILTAFNLFHFSLTQFSVVSGALAVGIGFGSQNLIGNFISGIILLVERPINQGDVIELDGQVVTVQELGPRSTIVRSGDNTHVIVPNSRLLEQSVTNWTLSDDVVRKKIRLGVAYGTSTREVDRVLMEVMLGLASVNRTPAPNVRFSDFGESSMIFEAQFWSSLAERVEVETELRHRIAEAFVKAGITMSFPQRDVHLETLKPIQIEVIAPKSGSASP
jgi:small-conductance mechanosensitive channel